MLSSWLWQQTYFGVWWARWCDSTQ